MITFLYVLIYLLVGVLVVSFSGIRDEAARAGGVVLWPMFVIVGLSFGFIYIVNQMIEAVQRKFNI